MCPSNHVSNQQDQKSSIHNENPSSSNEALAAALEDIATLRSSAKTAAAEAAQNAQKLLRALDDVDKLMKEKDVLNVRLAEKQKEFTAAAAAVDEDKKQLNMKVSELAAALKAAAAKEAKPSFNKSISAADEEKNKTIAQQSLRISQLEGN